MTVRGRGPAAVLACVGGFILALTSPAGAFSPAVESQNFAKIHERQLQYETAAGQAVLSRQSHANRADAARAATADPERDFTANVASTGDNLWAGDVRLYGWQEGERGLVRPVLFTARNGATLSGHVWATRAGPRRRPGIVIDPGSLGAPERLYWWAAQALAKDGYVVLTFDAQGQGLSDVHGESPDRDEGVPAQSTGTPFFDGAQDALDFLLSSARHPYVPRASRTTHTVHAAKQRRRVREGLDAAYDPFSGLLDVHRIGLAGHSYGAVGATVIGEQDPRVGAIVAWDNLCSLTCSRPGAPFSAPRTKPALGISADYFLSPTRYTSAPDPLGKSTASLELTRRGADTGEIVIRGGTHFEFSYFPNPGLGATLRGIDLAAWYTEAWFDKYLKRAPSADRRLLSARWRNDRAEAAVDPTHDGNLFSFYYRSRLDIHLGDGRRFDCENLRDGGCPLVRRDGQPAAFSYLRQALSHDRPTGLRGRRRP